MPGLLIRVLIAVTLAQQASGFSPPPLSPAMSLARPSGGNHVRDIPAPWADGMAKQALSGITLEYPHKVDHLWLQSDGPLESPKSLHPAFYGSYDWHSSVHSHWALARLLRCFRAELSDPSAVEEALCAHLTPSNMQREADYFQKGETFERPYGWGWLLKLSAELSLGAGCSSPGAFTDLAANIQPLTQRIRDLWLSYLPKLGYPVRSGVHSNTAFALTLTLDYAKQVGDETLEAAVREAGHRLYGSDRGYNPDFEPSGEDFLSQGVSELLLMRRLMEEKDFAEFAQGFVHPGGWEEGRGLLKVPMVGDRTDARLCHLDGLLLSKSWGLRVLAGGLRVHEGALHKAADDHYAGAQWETDNYAGTHWLHSFALLALTEME